MAKIGLSFTLKRIQKIRKILSEHSEGIWLRKLSNLCGLKPSTVNKLINNFFSGKLEIKKFGKVKILKLIDNTPSKKERRLIQREKAIKLAYKLRRDGLSYSEISNKLKKKIGYNLWLTNYLRNVEMSEKGKARYLKKISEDRRRAGRKGGRKHIKSGHIFRIQPLRMKGYLNKIMARIPNSSKILSLPKVRIISHCLFDGFVMKNAEKHRYVMGYSNKSRELINQFVEDMRNVYNLEPTDEIEKKSGIIVRYCCKAVVEDLLRYTSFVDGKEKIPLEIINSPVEWKIEFLKCFWDDEGMVGFSEFIDKKGYKHVSRFVEAFLKNKNLLLQLKELHESIGINVLIRGNKIRISKKEDLHKFAKLINFSPGLRVSYPKSRWNGWKKKEVLRLAIQSYKR
jgi:DNA-binding transcriptional ArsR family regulator